VLLHGFPETSFAWRFQIPALAQRYRVIARDLRGYGETDKPAAGCDKRNMARDRAGHPAGHCRARRDTRAPAFNRSES
jgi:haloacetate dehalogenase